MIRGRSKLDTRDTRYEIRDKRVRYPAKIRGTKDCAVQRCSLAFRSLLLAVGNGRRRSQTPKPVRPEFVPNQLGIR
jgi:hypothetical protein